MSEPACHILSKTGLIAAGVNLRCCLALFYALASARAESRLPIPCYKRVASAGDITNWQCEKPSSHYLNHGRHKGVNAKVMSIVKSLAVPMTHALRDLGE